MLEFLSQLRTIDLTVILWGLMAFSVLGLILAIGMIRAMRKSRERYLLIGLVLDLLEEGIAPEEITALLRAIGVKQYAGFNAVQQQLFRRFANRRAAQVPPEAFREVADPQWEPACSR